MGWISEEIEEGIVSESDQNILYVHIKFSKSYLGKAFFFFLPVPIVYSD